MKYVLLLLSFQVLVSCGSKESQALIQDAINDKLDEKFCSERQTNLPFADGDGTINNPYSICNTQQFNKINNFFITSSNLDRIQTLEIN